LSLVFGLFKQSITNVSLFSTVGTPEADDPYEFYVYIAPYNWDRAVDSTFMAFEYIATTLTFIYFGYSLTEYWFSGNNVASSSLDTWTKFYLGAIFGLLMWAAVLVDTAGLALKAFYNLVAISYVTVTK